MSILPNMVTYLYKPNQNPNRILRGKNKNKQKNPTNLTSIKVHLKE